MGSYPNIKVLALTKHDDLELLSRVLIVGGSGYLIKPVSVNQLVEAIKAVMKGKYYLGFQTSMNKPNLGIGKDP